MSDKEWRLCRLQTAIVILEAGTTCAQSRLSFYNSMLQTIPQYLSLTSSTTYILPTTKVVVIQDDILETTTTASTTKGGSTDNQRNTRRNQKTHYKQTTEQSKTQSLRFNKMPNPITTITTTTTASIALLFFLLLPSLSLATSISSPQWGSNQQYPPYSTPPYCADGGELHCCEITFNGGNSAVVAASDLACYDLTPATINCVIGKCFFLLLLPLLYLAQS